DGRTWAVGRPERVPVRRSPSGQFHIAPPLGRGPILKQDIYLDPIGTDVVFAAPRPIRMDLRAGGVNADDMGSLSVPNASARLHYQVESELETIPASIAGLRDARPAMEGLPRGRYLQLPPLSPSIGRLSREITAGSRDSYEAALKLNDFLLSRFRYTLAKPQTALEPLDEFLFVRRSGNCEYFAAALAVMLRTLGVPARVVGGFQRGEWNPYGHYFMVRLSDAHAWVEAYIDGLGWVTFDPSPRAAMSASARPSPMAMYFDAARMRWYRYVINWSLQDQWVFATTVHRQAKDAGLAFAWPTDWRSKLAYLVPAGLLAVAVLGYLLWRLRRKGPAGSPTGQPPRFYSRALRALARRGLSPGTAETARQFSARTGLESPRCAEPFARITSTYERARFGLAALTEDDLREMERCVLALEQR
ncbi:MAG TPA: transglutaminase domain-containing protein, partial [Candidatus Methylomirabilis sp.]|nr:transglutaminase domain-containing protein [Candidatus Methylomirabilis sp.]